MQGICIEILFHSFHRQNSGLSPIAKSVIYTPNYRYSPVASDPSPRSCSIKKQNSVMHSLPRAEVVPMKKSRLTEEQIVFARDQI
jgi:hypothetical protein